MVRNTADSKTKWVVITGGVLSGLGKGVVTSSLGALLQSQGFSVSATKIDPYINIDAGTMRPTVHGEVYVTFDGGETDQDLGNYERFLDYKISRKNNITTGQVYQEVIRKERNLEYGGSDVEVTKHIPEEVKRRLLENAVKDDADFMLVEIGGTVGDYQNIIFLEAVRQMRQEGEKIMFVHVSYVPMLGNVGELKTKPTQHSVRALNSAGIFADMIVVRGPMELDDPRKEKIGYFCNINKSSVISGPDVSSIYSIPCDYEVQGVGEQLAKFFGFAWQETSKLEEWQSFTKKLEHLSGEVRIGIVGKYFTIGSCTLEDSYISVIEAVKAACFAEGKKPKVVWLDSGAFEKHPDTLKSSLNAVDGVIVPGGFGSSGVEGKIAAIKYCREQKIPFLGICYGMQLAVVEHARNILGMHGAQTTEIDQKTSFPVVAVLPEQIDLLKKKQFGNSMRLGDYSAVLKKGSLLAALYGAQQVVERHRHRYEVNPQFVAQLETKGLVFSGRNVEHGLVEFMERSDHPFFVGTQAHPEFTSRPMQAQPLFHGLVKAALKRKKE
jgi:CTP synthase